MPVQERMITWSYVVLGGGRGRPKACISAEEMSMMFIWVCVYIYVHFTIFLSMCCVVTTDKLQYHEETMFQRVWFW